jgi:hypothetical protein
MPVEGTITKADFGQLWRDATDAAKRGAKKMAKGLARKHERMLESGSAPVGSQKPNAPSTRRRKSGKPPLVDTGRLKSALAQRIVEGRGIVRLLPPANRVQVLRRLHLAGYTTIYDRLPANYTDEADRTLQQEMSKVELKTR